MVRLSMANEQGGEFFMMLPAKPGKSWRETRDKALDDIQSAIDQGCEPGEVIVDD